MRPSRLHLTRTSLLVGASVAALVVGTAAPGAAGGAKNTVYKAAVGFEGSVSANLTTAGSTMHLTDYATSEYYDRVVGGPGSGETVAVTLAPDTGPVSCRKSKGALSNISIYGASTTWASMPLGSSMGARVDVQCLLADGQHIFHWGKATNRDGSYDRSRTTNCVQLTRHATDPSVFTLNAPGAAAGCPTQDTVINTRVQHTADEVMRDMPFSATITAPGLKAPTTG